MIHITFWRRDALRAWRPATGWGPPALVALALGACCSTETSPANLVLWVSEAGGRASACEETVPGRDMSYDYTGLGCIPRNSEIAAGRCEATCRERVLPGDTFESCAVRSIGGRTAVLCDATRTYTTCKGVGGP